ncbi:flagellar hook-associated protein FlgK [Alphaproteobacteria bacterium]|nr:flagellar hook-associated protein FlgK [Alphaproteobacteria bacterium]
MASLFEIGKTGVQAYRQSLSVTGQNIANINTDGYNKREADVTEIAGVSGGATNVSDQTGLGVRVDKIRRSFNTFLADKTRSTTSDFSKLDNFVKNLNELENMLLPQDSDLGTFIGKFFSSLQDIASRPDDLSARTVTIENGKALANSFNSYDRSLKNFKNSASKEVDIQIDKINLSLKQVSEINRLIRGSGKSDASNDILDARDLSLKELSKLINFSVDYDQTGAAEITLGDSGKGPILIEGTSYATITSVRDEQNISLKINRDGLSYPGNGLSSGIVSGLLEYYNLVESVQGEISALADKLGREFNEIQTSGIDLNGNQGKSMFSTNSMAPIANSFNKSNLDFEIVIGNPDKIIQENISAKFIKFSNSWEVNSSKGISFIQGNKLSFDGFEVQIIGNPEDGDIVEISPNNTRAGAFRFNLISPNDFAAASKNLISSSAQNVGSVELKLLGKTALVKDNFLPPKIDEVFTRSSNPLLATSFLKDGVVSSISGAVKSINLNSIGNQSSATFSVSDSILKDFTSLNLTLANGNVVNLVKDISDPGDGIKSVQELADLLNSGQMLDGKSRHNFRDYGMYASGSNGTLTIASSISDITSGSILASGNTFSPSIFSVSSSDALASDIQILSRDGRHISGKALTSSQIAALIKEENGFLKDAEYKNDYLNTDYRGINLTRKTANGNYVQNFGSNLSYKKQSTDADGLFTNKNATSLSGTLTLDGLLSNSNDIDANITITSSGNDSGINFTVTGYDQDGIYQTETITGSNAAQAIGSKVFKSVSSIVSSGNAAGTINIGTKANSYNLKTTNANNTTNTTEVPINASAQYLTKKLSTDLAGTGISVDAKTRVLLGPFKSGTSGDINFKLAGKNNDPLIINATIDANDISALAKVINQYSTQTGLRAINTSDFDQLIIESEDGYDISITEISAPSDFDIFSLGEDFNKLSKALSIDVSSTDKVSAYIKGNIRFTSSQSFNNQIDTGLILSATQDALDDGYIDISLNSSGETAKIKPVIFNQLDNNQSDPNGKKAIVGLSKYGLDINQKQYKVGVTDNDSLYASNNPGSAGTLTLDGALRNANNLNAVVSIYCSASETGNIFTVTGTDQDGVVISENITGVASSNTAIGSTRFSTISSITSSATASGNVQIGTISRLDINDDDSLVQELSVNSSGSLTLNGPLSTSSYLGAQISVSSNNDTTSNSFIIVGTDLNGAALTETISGSNSSTVKTTNIFQTVSSINVTGTIASMIKVGTQPADGDWATSIDANALEIDTNYEISKALVNELRVGTPVSQIKGGIITSLPPEGTTIELSYEGQQYKGEIKNGEVIINGPEDNRIKARFNGTSDLDQDAISSSQSGTGSTSLLLNGVNAIQADADGLVDNESTAINSNFTIDGVLASEASTGLNSFISISSASNNSSVTFTITGTDIDGNAQTETITGVNNNTVTGTKLFKTVSQISNDNNTYNVNVGTAPAIVNIDGTRVSLTSTANETNNTFQIVGTDVNGLSQTETIYGPNSGGTVYTKQLFKTITSITPSISTQGNIQAGTAPGFQFMATAEGTLEGDQFQLLQNTANIQNASRFGLSSSTNTLKGNLVLKPTSSSEAIRILVDDGTNKTKYSIKFDSSGDPQFYNAIGSQLTGSPPSGLTLSWNESSGITDVDGIFSGSLVADVGIVPNGVLSTTDDDSLFTSKTTTAGNLILDGSLENSKALNALANIYCAGDESSNSFTIKGYDENGLFVTDIISGVNGATATGSVTFSQILSVNVANNTASTIKVGTKAQAVSFEPSAITITPAGSDTGDKYTIVGLDQFGNSQTEVLTAGAANVTVTTTKVFSKISSIKSGNSSSSNVTVGTQRVGNLSINSLIGGSTFTLDSNPNAERLYGFKTQRASLTVDKEGINFSNLSGEGIILEIPSNSIQNSVAERISLENLPNEDFIMILGGNGARKISSDFDFQENISELIEPELTIKVDAINSNKVEIFEKASGHSIATRILDQNRVFEFNGNKFQFSEQPLVENTFALSENKSGTGDSRNIMNMINLQMEDENQKGKGNFQEIFSTTLAKVGSNVQANKLSLSAAKSNMEAAEGSESEFAGVNLDEEAANLLKYQQAYQASARILQTAKELFQTLIEVV